MNVTVQSSSHNFATETREFFASLSKLNPVTASELMCGMFDFHWSLVDSLDPFGIATVMFCLDVMRLHIEFGIKKCVVAPESAIAVLFVFVGTK